VEFDDAYRAAKALGGSLNDFFVAGAAGGNAASLKDLFDVCVAEGHLVRVNDGYSALAAGIGFDATVMRFTPRALKYWLGRTAYLLAGAWWLPQTPLFSCTIKADGEETQVDAVVVLVLNAGMLGAAPFRFGPGIAIDDGWLDICVYRPRNVRDRASVVWSILRQKPNGLSVMQRKARSVEIKAPGVQWHEVDGDVYRGNVLRAEIVPGAVNIIV